MSKKCKTLSDLIADPRVELIVMDYDGKGRHMISCAEGYRFESCNSTMELGNVKELCQEVNERLELKTTTL